MDRSFIYYLIATVGTICGIIFGYLGYSNRQKKENTETGKSNGTLMSDVGYIKAGVDDLKHKQEKAEERYYGLVERVKGVEESVKSAHQRIDEHIAAKD